MKKLFSLLILLCVCFLLKAQTSNCIIAIHHTKEYVLNTNSDSKLQLACKDCLLYLLPDSIKIMYQFNDENLCNSICITMNNDSSMLNLINYLNDNFLYAVNTRRWYNNDGTVVQQGEDEDKKAIFIVMTINN
jgi:hypothetical protein